MKKLAILLSLVMVFGLAASAMAADLSTSGYVKYGFSKDTSDKLFASFDSAVDWRVQFKYAVDETLSATIRLDDKVVDTTVNSISVDRAFFTKDFGAFSVTVGKQGIGGSGNYFSNYTVGNGVSAKVPFDMGSVAGMMVMTGKEKADFAFTGKVTPVENLDVAGEFKMAYGTTEYAKSWDVEAGYTVAGFTVYGELAESNDASDGFEGKVVGASTSVSGFDLVGEYDLAAETFYVNAETTMGGVLYGVEFTSESEAGAEANLGGYAKVSF